MDDKKIREGLRKRHEELIEAELAIAAMNPCSYMDDCIDDFKEKPNIKTDWLNKKMR
jgi:hypothetical protein